MVRLASSFLRLTISRTSHYPPKPLKPSHLGTNILFRMAATCRRSLIKGNLEFLEASMSTAVADLPNTITTLPETIECPLCVGKGTLTRTEVLERLGMKDFARVAQLSAEEAIRILLKTEKESEQARWA